VVYFVPLGILLALAFAPLRVPRGVRRILLGGALLLAAGLGTSIEMLQVFLPKHVPDSTDVLLYLTGTVLGLLATVRVLDARNTRRDDL
jgi:VanZ family protein